MSNIGHTPAREAAIMQAAKAAGAIDATDFLALISNDPLVDPVDAVSKLRLTAPYLFQDARDMSRDEYGAAKLHAVKFADAQRAKSDIALALKHAKEKSEKKGRLV